MKMNKVKIVRNNLMVFRLVFLSVSLSSILAGQISFAAQSKVSVQPKVNISTFTLDADAQGKLLCTATGITIATGKSKKFADDITSCKDFIAQFGKTKLEEINIQTLDAKISRLEVADSGKLKLYFEKSKEPVILNISEETREQFQKEMSKYGNFVSALSFLPQILIKSAVGH
jgi:hypothetical protein